MVRNIQETTQDLAAQAGEVLFDIGEDCDYLPLLKAGSIRVVKPFQTGWEMLLYRVVPGQVCILTVTCILSDWRQLARVIVEKDVEAVSIPRDSLFRLTEGSSDFRSFIFANYSVSIFSMLNSVEVTLTSSIEQRLVRVLLAKRTDVIWVTHQGLADELGTAREVISRILEDFEEKGIVKLKRGMIFIQDLEALIQYRPHVTK